MSAIIVNLQCYRVLAEKTLIFIDYVMITLLILELIKSQDEFPLFRSDKKLPLQNPLDKTEFFLKKSQGGTKKGLHQSFSVSCPCGAL